MKATADPKDGGKRQYNKNGLFSADPAEWRREYKRKQRRKVGVISRAEAAARAQEKREAAAREKKLRKEEEFLHAKHDAHVRRYLYLEHCRLREKTKYERNPQAGRDRVAKYRQALPDPYVVQNLKAMGIAPEVITPGLVALKREQMQYRRMAREIKHSITNHTKENDETITEHP